MKPITEQFLQEFRIASERKWSSQKINNGIYGFQFQQGTKWLPGLAEPEIESLENRLGGQLSNDFRLFLANFNGTDIPTINVYGGSSEPTKLGPGVYSYPRDLNLVEDCLKEIRPDLPEIQSVLKEQGFQLDPKNLLVPIVGHRFVVCQAHLESSSVLSICGIDAIVYSKSLKSFLESEFM